MNDQGPTLSILMPAKDEAATLATIVERVLARPEVHEIVMVDDGSSDGSWDIMQGFVRAHPGRVQAHRHEQCRGKGAAVRTALEHATGDYVMIQDCDLEYSPDDYPAMLQPVRNGRARVVYGTRAFSSHSAYSFWFVMGNRLVTLVTNILFNCYLSDMETCYKLVPREVMASLRLSARGFDMEPQVTARLLKRGYRIYEVPVEYIARSREEGKKLSARHGVQALWVLLRERVTG
ncbi:MAG: glycosyltransferase family 2 protein [Candidatus Dormibacteria bacterium]